HGPTSLGSSPGAALGERSSPSAEKAPKPWSIARADTPGWPGTPGFETNPAPAAINPWADPERSGPGPIHRTKSRSGVERVGQSRPAWQLLAAKRVAVAGRGKGCGEAPARSATPPPQTIAAYSAPKG